MTRPVIFIWLGTIGALAAILGLSLPAAVRARHEAAAARSTLQDAARDAGVVIALRAGVPDLPEDDQARGGLTPRAAAALERAGLPASALAGLSPEAESQVAGSPGLRVSRRRATLTLSGVTLPQVGRFLEAWRSAEPAWTASNIDLSAAGGPAPEAGGDLPLRAVIAIESISVRQSGDRH